MNFDEYKIDNLIIDFLRGKLSAQGKEELKNWLAKGNSNKTYFRQMYLLWKASAINAFKADETDDAYQKLQLGSVKGKTTDLPISRKYLMITFRKLAAIIVLAFIGGAFLYSLFPKKQLVAFNNKSQNLINVPLGSKTNITLPDGSEVFLNAGSKLTYGMDYGQKLREVNLIGEGYFKVARQAHKPFIVYTQGANIKALGTEFNVKAYPDENVIETILVQGSVIVSKTGSNKNIGNSENKESVVLKQGQKAQIYKVPQIAADNVKTIKNKKEDADIEKKNYSISEKAINLKPSDAEIETSWKDQRWIIKKENLNDLFVLFERRYNVSILSMSDGLSKYQFSGTIQNETLEQVLSIVSLTVPISYSIDKGRVEITLNQKLENKYKQAYRN